MGRNNKQVATLVNHCIYIVHCVCSCLIERMRMKELKFSAGNRTHPPRVRCHVERVVGCRISNKIRAFIFTMPR